MVNLKQLLIFGRFYTALFPALEPTHCAFVVCDSERLKLLYVHRNRRLIRDGSPERRPRLSHSS